MGKLYTAMALEDALKRYEQNQITFLVKNIRSTNPMQNFYP